MFFSLVNLRRCLLGLSPGGGGAGWRGSSPGGRPRSGIRELHFEVWQQAASPAGSRSSSALCQHLKIATVLSM